MQLVAFPFAILYGKMSVKYGVRNMILFGIATYMVVCLVALGLEPLRLMGEIPLLLGFVVLAFLVGTAQGGIQALSRSFYGKLVPESSANEFFGFFDIFGKFSAVLGPFLFSLVWDSTQQVHLGIIPVLYVCNWSVTVPEGSFFHEKNHVRQSRGKITQVSFLPSSALRGASHFPAQLARRRLLIFE